ncbi:uncharacterized protein LOC120075284 isoform X1 [Benincasa hispida]|uniref:uncharacterized protein LOC120075284 isoform X1 n=1 Tax=Benincasa hispida TaxID=102211 RepID=UPI0019019CF1|nr:uncharacterized protein LOC120075284 isoform X1 [Benincasa hispida]
MRRILNPLVGRSFKSSDFRRLVQSAFTRLRALKNHHHRRYSEGRDDVVRLLQDGLSGLALSRCEEMIEHQNLLDAYGMIEGYLNLLMESIYLLGRGRECPDELKEAVSSVVFASSRWKDFSELEDIKSILTSQFGKEFTGRAVELRNNNSVNDSIMQKLSTRKPNMDSKMNLLKVIASDNGITLQLNEEDALCSSIQTRKRSRQQNRSETLATNSYQTRSSSRKHRR